MNKGNYLEKPNYPWASEDFDFIQEMILLVQQLVSFGGTNNFIVSGCAKTGTTYAPGIIVINGEILPFAGGVAVSGSLPGGTGPADWIEIVEIQDDVQVYDTIYTDVRRRRHVAPGGNTINFLGFERITSLTTLKTMVDSKQSLPIKTGSEAVSLPDNATYSKTISIPTQANIGYRIMASIYIPSDGFNSQITWRISEKTINSFTVVFDDNVGNGVDILFEYEVKR